MIFYSYNNCHKFKIYILLYLYFYILIFKNFKNFIKNFKNILIIKEIESLSNTYVHLINSYQGLDIK